MRNMTDWQAEDNLDRSKREDTSDDGDKDNINVPTVRLGDSEHW